MRLTLDELKGDKDKTVESNGVQVVYNSGLEDYLGDLSIDYQETGMQRGFIIQGRDLSSC